ncbi:pseudouridine synthase [Halteromyces radiatus]|uniref:pseudouridine synthase n=1 Tax=Halteromyces radiatus TaxID=101107 RepID=UPI00221FB54C|nr:pseudouridine synthase [Halteromyces radiatus]KAI8082705.1 pseudouridine synthase [Halteromyces radiatus]
MEKYKDWTKEQLLSHIEKLEQQSENKLSNNKSTKKHKKQQRPFDMTKYRQRRIALKVAYLGWKYAGFAAQGDEVNIPTVEGPIFYALEHCRLIVDRDSCDYTRCGRTDRGVSGLGQVIILNVRSKQLSQQKKEEEDDDFLPVEEELPYVDMLNGALPDDIHILAWAPVASQLNARFDCRSRTYRYLFRKEQLDLHLMQQAAQDFVGTHDFRNFCKLDPSKNITDYHRCILRCTLLPTSLDDVKEKDMVQLELQGTAFLWHQVRCMMSVLFLIGQHLEPPTIIKDLMDISRYPGRPEYPMASDLPLILYDCAFDSIVWHYAPSASYRVATHWDQMAYAQQVRALTCELFSQQTACDPIQDGKHKVVLGAGLSSSMQHYKPLALRPCCDTDERKKEKFSAKKRKRAILDDQ